MIRAAGILLLDPDGKALFLKRGPGGDAAGTWCIPGGKFEETDTDLEACAVRETLEECGYDASKDGLDLHTRQIASPSAMPPTADVVALPAAPAVGDAVDFTTFVARLPEQFVPTLDNESTGYAWAPVNDPPEPLHPGCRVALDRLTMDELGVARAMAAGRLTSPQRYMNVTLWNMRITGTGMAYRDTINEYVWREPSIYMNDEFVARCNGLLVIMHHPKKRSTVDSAEFNDRTVGSIFLPYLRPEADEVWGIAKIYDDEANQMLSGMDLSTSPAVVLGGPNDEKIDVDGKALLIEGEPRLLDHLAICERGVWDKKGPPAGIINDSTGGTTVADEPKNEDGKADADAGDKLDTLLTKLDAACARMDAMEDREKERDDRSRKDAEELKGSEEGKADGAKKDAEEKPSEAGEGAATDGKKDAAEEEEKAKADKARKDAEEKEKEEERADAAALRRDINELRGKLKELVQAQPIARTEDERVALTDAQARADQAYGALGKSAPRWMDGETAGAYAIRLARGLQQFSARWKGANLHTVAADSSAWKEAETQVYADAMAFAEHPTDLADGEMRQIVTTDATGRRITTFRGESRTWLGQFGGTPRRVNRIRNNSAS